MSRRRRNDSEYLTADQERELALRWKNEGDEKAMHQLVESHLRMVKAVARRSVRYGLDRDDLIQEGYVGLLRAAATFEPDRGIRFSTYALWWVRFAMQDFTLRNWSLVRLSLDSVHKRIFYHFAEIRTRLMADGVPPSQLHSAIARELKVEEHLVDEVAPRILHQVRSIHAPISDDGSTIVDALESPDARPDEVAEQAIDGGRRIAALHTAMSTLSVREQRVLTGRHLKTDPEKLHHLGTALGLSRERIRQIEIKAIQRLRKAIRSAELV